MIMINWVHHHLSKLSILCIVRYCSPDKYYIRKHLQCSRCIEFILCALIWANIFLSCKLISWSWVFISQCSTSFSLSYILTLLPCILCVYLQYLCALSVWSFSFYLDFLSINDIYRCGQSLANSWQVSSSCL